MATETSAADAPLPGNWPLNVMSTVFLVISLARLSVTYSRSWIAKSVNAGVRLQVRGTKGRYESRLKWPKESPCASPQMKVKKRRASRLAIAVRFHEGSKHLPVVEVKPGA